MSRLDGVVGAGDSSVLVVGEPLCVASLYSVDSVSWKRE
jgi:hypothetical protein